MTPLSAFFNSQTRSNARLLTNLFYFLRTVKIVQTFWSGGQVLKEPLLLTNGWIAPEYHWLSWALSCLQLRKYYDQVELVTDSLGKYVLIDLLKLPYTSVRVELDCLNGYPPKLWALAKIYSYTHQHESFLHVDGDVYIWQPFAQRLMEADLVAQNFEVNFPFYQSSLQTILNKFTAVPDWVYKEFSKSQRIHSCNAGVIGGRRLDIFKKHGQAVFDLVDNNLKQLKKAHYLDLNICLEQFLFHALARYHNVPITYLIDSEEEFDPTYPGFANFHEVPYKTHYIHTMADYKRHEDVCWHLSNRMRQDYPGYYYHILALCQRETGFLHQPAYQLPELSPVILGSKNYLLNKQKLVDGDLNAKSHENKWSYFYAKSMITYEQVQKLFSLPEGDLLKQFLSLDDDCVLIEEVTPALKQIIETLDIRLLGVNRHELDDLNMILLNALIEGKSIKDAIQETALYLSDEDYQYHYGSFQNLVLDRIKELYYKGVVRWQ